MTDCKVCSLPHDPQIHEATLRVRAWFKADVLRSIVRVTPGKATHKPPIMAAHTMRPKEALRARLPRT